MPLKTKRRSVTGPVRRWAYPKNPSWFPEGFDRGRGEFLFVKVIAADCRRTIFFGTGDGTGRARYSRGAPQPRLRTFSHEQPQPRIIWHTGFCCSTLLAKALDLPGCNLSLCEPGIWSRSRMLIVPACSHAIADGSSTARVPSSLAGLCDRRAVTLKPAPAANQLLRTRRCRLRPMLFLYSDCRSFLVSICKMGESGRKYVRNLFLACSTTITPRANGRHRNSCPCPISNSPRWSGTCRSPSSCETGRSSVWRAASLIATHFSMPVDTLRKLDDFFSLGLAKTSGTDGERPAFPSQRKNRQRFVRPRVGD